MVVQETICWPNLGCALQRAVGHRPMPQWGWPRAATALSYGVKHISISWTV